jgi:hypothetical protein
MDRRKFIKGSGLIGGLFGSVVAGKVIVEKIHTKEIITQVSDTVDSSNAPTVGVATLMLQTENPDLSTKKDLPIVNLNNNQYVFTSSNYNLYDVVEKNTVSLAAGKDNRLWIKVNNEWLRLSVDKTVNS